MRQYSRQRNFVAKGRHDRLCSSPFLGGGTRRAKQWTNRIILLMGKESDLRSSFFDVVENRLKCRVTETARFSTFHIVFESGTESFWSKIESVPEWFVDTVKRVTTGHEHLAFVRWPRMFSQASQNDSPFQKLWNMNEGA
jgi:hypothetical protein